MAGIIAHSDCPRPLFGDGNVPVLFRSFLSRYQRRFYYVQQEREEYEHLTLLRSTFMYIDNHQAVIN